MKCKARRSLSKKFRNFQTIKGKKPGKDDNTFHRSRAYSYKIVE
jgi:hypothetical protein